MSHSSHASLSNPLLKSTPFLISLISLTLTQLMPSSNSTSLLDNLLHFLLYFFYNAFIHLHVSMSFSIQLSSIHAYNRINTYNYIYTSHASYFTALLLLDRYPDIYHDIYHVPKSTRHDTDNLPLYNYAFNRLVLSQWRNSSPLPAYQSCSPLTVNVYTLPYVLTLIFLPLTVKKANGQVAVHQSLSQNFGP